MKKLLGILLSVSIIAMLATGCPTTSSSTTDDKKERVEEKDDLEVSPDSEKPQKNGFSTDDNQTVVVGGYSFSIPEYWVVQNSSDTQYKAAAESGKKLALLQIMSSESNGQVSFDALKNSIKNGKMDKTIAEPFDDCGEINYKEFDNGVIRGYICTTTFSLNDNNGYAEILIFPSEESNSWVQMNLLQSDNTKYDYTEDIAKVRDSICLASDVQVVAGQEASPETTVPDATTKDTPKETSKETSKVQATETTKQVAETKETAKQTEAPATTTTETPSTTNSAPNNAAVSAAKNYLQYMPFSREGLISQLEFEGYSHDEAVYGVDNCGADWNQQALKAAKSYLDFTAFSKNGLIGQLEYEKYTHDQAVYGVENCGADWNAQALRSAKNYLDFAAFSKSGLIGQLEYEEFTHEQAVYGVENCGADWNAQAVRSAKEYLDFSSFTRDELIGLLEYEGFTHEQAVYGVDNCGVALS